jgi:hypothetical protein
LSVAAATKVKTAQIEDRKTLLLMREVDVDALKLSLGDTLRLRAGVQSLKDKMNMMPKLVDDTGVKKPAVDVDKPKYSQRQVEELLAGKGAIDAGVGAKSVTSTTAGTSDTTVACIRELMRDLLNIDDTSITNAKGEKALLPINFLSCVSGTQDAEDIIHSSKGINLVMQSSMRRVTPEKLSVGQWIAGNARILQKLTSENKLTPAQIDEYLEYNRKVGDLLQIFTSASVFLLDNNHRLEVHRSVKKSKDWSDIDCTLEVAHLKKRDESGGSLYVPAAASASASRSATVGGSVRRGQLRPCWLYNSKEGCSFGRNCRYDHVEGDSRQQRQTSQLEKAPRFRTAVVPSKGGN